LLTAADNVKAVKENIASAAVRAGRDPSSVLLVAASKTKPAEMIREAVAAGIDAAGENRVNELIQKKGQGAYEGVPLHFIGNLQSNKVKLITGRVDLIQSVSSIELIKLVSSQAERLELVQDILLQVNIGYEKTKGGLLPETVREAIALASSLNGIRVLGLMAIPPAMEANTKNYAYFNQMYKLFVDIRAEKYDNVDMRFLSMGMSGDYAAAIEEGSNMVRVGSAIFGSRTYI
jgi:pyridoxal phosphate enzyme (YggS family)